MRRIAALSAVASRPIRTPNGAIVPTHLAAFTSLVSLLYSACFVVIAYRVGPRASEILALRFGCVRALTADEAGGTEGVAVIVGSIFKNESGYYGRSHEWVVPPAAIHAVTVLEALSEPHRARSSRQELWLRTRARSGVSEWLPESALPLQVAGTERIILSLARLAAWLQLPAYEGKVWHLSTHQARKTFARFVALRERTGLFALAQHLGHRDRTVTDKGYVGNDYARQEDIEQHVLEQSLFAWEDMLTAASLGGRAGAQILASRPRFRGARMKQELRDYAWLLVEAGLTLGVCDWSYCVYRQEHGACRGTISGPNPILREPSTCARCRNFVVTVKHRPYWEEQLHRHRALLDERYAPDRQPNYDSV
jgi:hypothetical protein